MDAQRSWYYAQGEQTLGPVPEQEIEVLIRQAVISPSTWILAEGTDNWMLAQDSPFSNESPNASLESAAQTEGVPGSKRSEPSQPPDRKQRHNNFVRLLTTKISQIVEAIVVLGKWNVQLAAISAQIEKLKRFDLTKANYLLGKRAYELKLTPEHFGSRYDEIAVLEQSIATKMAGNEEQGYPTALTKVKKRATNIQMAAGARALALRLRLWLTKLGEQYALHRASKSVTQVQLELHAVESVKGRIADLESRRAAVLAGQASINGHIQTKTNIIGYWQAALRSRKPWQGIIVACLLCFFAARAISLLRYLNKSDLSGPSRNTVAALTERALDVTPGTPLPRLDPGTLRGQYESMTASQETKKILFEWEKAIALAPHPSTSSQSQLWSAYEKALVDYESLLHNSTIIVLQQLDNRTYEVRYQSDSLMQETFVLMTFSTSFQSMGRASLPIDFVETKTVQLKNGFERRAAIFREVIQEEPQEVKARLDAAALAFAVSVRSSPPDDATLEDYIAKIGRHRADRERNTLSELKGERMAHYQGMAVEQNVLYVCLQARLRNEFHPIGPAEVTASDSVRINR